MAVFDMNATEQEKELQHRLFALENKYLRTNQQLEERIEEVMQLRASEARMRKALEAITSDFAPEHIDKMGSLSGGTLARTALSTPVSDWLAQRDRRVAEAQREACAARFTTSPMRSYDEDQTEEIVRTTPLVEFKPEDET